MSQKCERLNSGMGDQEPIKRITMRCRQSLNPFGVRSTDILKIKPGFCNQVTEIRGRYANRQPSVLAAFDCYFPYRCNTYNAEVEIICQQGSSCSLQPFIAERPPQDNMRIEKKLHQPFCRLRSCSSSKSFWTSTSRA